MQICLLIKRKKEKSAKFRPSLPSYGMIKNQYLCRHGCHCKNLNTVFGIFNTNSGIVNAKICFLKLLLDE